MKDHEALPPIDIVRGEGAWLFDSDGKRYFDAISSWWVNLFGHCHPKINAAVKDQLDTLEHVLLAGFTHPPVVELSNRLVELTPPGLDYCFYTSPTKPIYFSRKPPRGRNNLLTNRQKRVFFVSARRSVFEQRNVYANT